MAQKPSIPKGTRDFLPAEMLRRNYIFETIKNIFEKHAFQPIETPSMEKLSNLLGKYGEEGDKLLFKVLDSGDFLKKVDDNILRKRDLHRITFQISEKGLRYDLTVPFARFVVQHQNEIIFPFRRYQIQPVWRADKPQKGRYREFYQCDADVIGSDSVLNEFELLQIIDEVFDNLNIPVIIKINNRKILYGIIEGFGLDNKFTDITVAIDKLDKIGIDGVLEELYRMQIDKEKASALLNFFKTENDINFKLKSLKEALKNSEFGLKGIEEIEKLLSYTEKIRPKAEIELDLSLARGLDYYTGAIIEVKAANVEMGSICGGGRYDDLTGIFGLKDVSGVGISFGADRIYDVLENMEAFPDSKMHLSKLLFVNFGEKEEEYCLRILTDIRNKGIPAEIFPEAAKMKKQMKYADRNGIPWVAIAGEEEISSGKIKLKNMSTGDEKLISPDDIIEMID